jgi:hypothetical protein
LGGNNSTRYTTTIYNKNNEEILRIEIQCGWGILYTVTTHTYTNKNNILTQTSFKNLEQPQTHCISIRNISSLFLL